MRVVCLPGREEHGKAGTQGSEDTGFRGTKSHGGGLEQAGKGAVERIDSVVEELTEAAGSACSSSLLSVDVVHGLVHEQSEGKAHVEP